MIRKIAAGIPFYEFEIFQQFRRGLKHAVFTRHSDILTPKTVQTIFETNAHPVAFKNQLHGTKLHIIPAQFNEKKVAQPRLGINCLASLRLGLFEGDIFVTSEQQIPLVIRIADCASILLFDPTKKIIANIHAGWRGLAAKIIHRTIQKLQQRFLVRPENIFAGISPMLGPCCSRFTEPKKELPNFLHQYILQKNMVNLWSITESQLRECGVLKKHIENPRICTSCNPENFFSYRREGDSGRFGTAIMLQ
ncbi:polyphenol oxidase family protein [Candidatus Peregrinibacteria bacterium]|nr:polyphenol oxidase family protein [Candidatus Peregrinibacteria bacterium]